MGEEKRTPMSWLGIHLPVSKALEVPAHSGNWKTAATSWLQHKGRCVTATRAKTVDGAIVNVPMQGCAMGTPCEKGLRLLKVFNEIDAKEQRL